MTDAEMGLDADRAWQVEFGDRWREVKEQHFARKARESQQDRERERRQQAEDFAEGVARDVAAMKATFRDIQQTLVESARLREERERRLEDWAIDDAWARLRGGR